VARKKQNAPRKFISEHNPANGSKEKPPLDAPNFVICRVRGFMTYASDITSFDELVVPWEQLRLFAFSALLVAFTIVAAALALSALSATCTFFASFALAPDLGPSIGIGRKPATLAGSRSASSAIRKPEVAVPLPMAAASARDTLADAKPAIPLGTATPRGASAATATPGTTALGATASLGVTTASLEAPLPPSVTGPRLVPFPPKRPFDAATTATAPGEAPSASQIRSNKDTPRPLPGDTKPRSGAAPEVAAVSTPPQDDRNPFQKLFSAFSQATGSAFASRTEGQGSVANLGARTALYDIEAHTVYLPSGERLEAHSGLGSRFDDPRSVSEKNRGATPPHLYDLELRRDLFHGVAALRLNPVGGGNMFGRAGILAHSYMLGPRGDSNGCVSFRDYPKFLRAFQNGEIARIAVVAHVGASYSVASSHN
jgi:hypothetical protein